MAGARRELAGVERRQKEILNALADGFRLESVEGGAVTLDARKAALTTALRQPPLPALHPTHGERLPREGDDARRRSRTRRAA